MKKFTTAKSARSYLEQFSGEFTIEDIRSLKAKTVIALANADREASYEAGKTL